MAEVLCAYDGSAGADAALRWAAEEAHRRSAALRIVSVLDFAHGAAAAGAEVAYPTPASVAAHERVQGMADTAAAQVRQTWPDLDVRAEALEGGVAGTVLAASQAADLVVLGARGLGGFRRLLLGSVSAAVAERATRPVVVVREDGDESAGPHEGQVVVGDDGSAVSSTAIRFALDTARRRGAAVTVVRALHLSALAVALPYAARPGLVPDEVQQAAQAALRERVTAWRGEAPDVPMTGEVRTGHPVPVLTTAATGAVLLVVGTRGRGGLAGTLLGSVSRGVLAHATGPVVVVPPRAGPDR